MPLQLTITWVQVRAHKRENVRLRDFDSLSSASYIGLKHYFLFFYWKKQYYDTIFPFGVISWIISGRWIFFLISFFGILVQPLLTVTDSQDNSTFTLSMHPIPKRFLENGNKKLKQMLQGKNLHQKKIDIYYAERYIIKVITAEKKRRMFAIFFLSSFCQLLSPRIQARTGWVRPDNESSDQPA